MILGTSSIPLERTHKLKVVGHRGASELGPENTMAAFLKALGLGVDVIEADVRRSRDGEFVLFHDEDLVRLTGQSKRIEDMELAELKKVIIGEDSTYGNQNIATLRNLLELDQGRVQVLLDLKLSSAFEKDLVQTIQRFEVERRVILGVRSVNVLKSLKKLTPHLLTLSFGSPVDVVWNMANEGVDILRLWSTWVNPGVIDRAKRASKPVWVMCGTPKENEVGRTTLEELLSYRRMGIEGVILNDPRLAFKANSMNIM